ncbi:uncharacterized protein [Prorops nasuta]|uniref:uncharacterized protein n=1 Tax=Prorops nasuta TaxID=863751 RepID=UPI0034CDD378
MKETLSTQTTSGYNNVFVNNNGETSTNNVANENSSRKYAMLSTEWVSAIGEELGMHPLPDSVLRRLAEDASYRLREVLHKCVTRLKHSRKKCLTSVDVNAVITNLCDTYPVLGSPDQLPQYHTEARVFVATEHFVDLRQRVNSPYNIVQPTVPFIQESEICDIKLSEARNNYAKRALKILFNGSQKTFQILLNDCATNAHLGGEGLVDKLMSIAWSIVISNNAQYTRVSTRTCQLIIAIASNSTAIYPYHLNSVQHLTELLLDLLLGLGFIHQNMESLFKECALKLMLRWPSIADKFVPTLENVLLMDEKNSFDANRRKTTSMELLASVQPLIFLNQEPNSPASLGNVLKSAPHGSVLWSRLLLAISAFAKSEAHALDMANIMEHYGDSLLPYLPHTNFYKPKRNTEPKSLPIITRNKIKYVGIRPLSNNRLYSDRQIAFPDSTLRGPRQEIRFAFAGGRPVPPSSLKRVRLRANYQILRSDLPATLALVASGRLLILKDKTKRTVNNYNLACVQL